MSLTEGQEAAMDLEMDSLISYQEDMQSRIYKGYENFKKASKSARTKAYAQGRLDTLEQNWSQFIKGHAELLRKFPRKTLNETEYKKNDVYGETEEKYLVYKCKIKEFLEAIEEQKQEETKSKNCQVKLPKINIPTFTGKYSEWNTFRDLFISSIHNRSDLGAVQKLHYLKGYLSGEAEQCLRHIPVTEANYARCWELLEQRYNNKKYICNFTLKRLFGQRSLVNESASGLKDLIDTTDDCLSGLQNIGVSVDSWDVIVIHIVTLKLDAETRRQWEFSISDSQTPDLPTYSQFKEFLTNRYRAMEFLPQDRVKLQPKFHSQSQPSNQHFTPVKSFHAMKSNNCPFCKEEHKIGQCKRFANESVESRRQFVSSNNICFCCMGSNHSAKFCLLKVRCQICKGKHHTLLHPKGTDGGKAIGSGSDANGGESRQDESKAASNPTQEPLVTCFSSRPCSFNQVLLATALVRAKARNGEHFVIRALLDQGSQSSFVTEATVQSLGLKKSPINSQIIGVGGEKGLVSKAMVSVEITSRVDPEVVIHLKAYVLSSITSLIPSYKIGPMEWDELSKITLADPEYHTPSRIDILLGAEVYSQIIKEGVKKGPLGSPMAQSTTLGWILSGAVRQSTGHPQEIQVMHCQVDENNQLKRFWELEADAELPKERALTDDDKRCEQLFETTTQRDEAGRYIVRLPFKNEEPQVTNSRRIAEKRLYALEKRLSTNPNLKKRYGEVIDEYLEFNHMELVPDAEIDKPGAIYLPHHAVVREDKDTTKVRAVFDASCKGDNQKSLNDNLFVGPTLQPELRHTIMRWRVAPICLTADIVKMYRQVKVSNEDIDYQRILWRRDNKSEINHYRMLRVTFGVASSPYLAVKALQQVALDEGKDYPLAASRVKDSFYMDDLLIGCQTIEEGVKIYKEMNALLGKAGFELQKWTSGDKRLVQAMKDVEMKKGIERTESEEKENIIKEGLKIKEDEIIKIVGLTWNRNNDSFRYKVVVPELEKACVTKRMIISDISRFYDPLGWAGPTIIIPKILIQKLWLAGLAWDEEVPKGLLEEWLIYREELKILERISIPRWVGTRDDDQLVELHGFSDASKVAYAAVVYLRVIDSKGNIQVALISSKTKVAPVKQVSIPRLELCGAVLLTKLMMEIAAVLKIDKTRMHAWTDSTVVLAWLNSHPNRWKVFVANRVSEILTHLDSHNWSHVVSKQNPADSASRGLRPSDLVQNEMWFRGPDFLLGKNIDYRKPKDLVTNSEESTKSLHVTAEESTWDRFSSLTRLVRVIAYCRRFINNCRTKNKTRGFLTTTELGTALKTAIRLCQAVHFETEMGIVKKKGVFPKGSSLRSLNPYVDEDGLLRVGGRLTESQLNDDRKHPILMPKKSHLTDLLVTDAHKQTLHGGPQLMLSYLHCKYWILGAKQLVKAWFRKCVTCARNAGVTQTQLMGQLPSARVTPIRPFKNSGVDYAGPIQIRTTKGRGHKSHKGYICLFVCMATRAIHLEVVTDLTSEGFLQAFKRFVARRGFCSDIWSDNGTNFTGAAAELKKLFIVEKKSMLEEVAENLATNGCTWHFIPSRSPNFGGLWEAGVKSVKHHLKRIIGQSTLTFEEMSTVLAQVEACLNSRPLSALPCDEDSEVSVLTPGHFLVGEPLLLPPERNHESANISSLRRWQYTQRMLQNFWRRWSQEYLTKFYHRYKWSSQGPQPKIGDIVVVKEDGLPACRWMYGRVIDVHPGLDDIVRVVSLKVKNGVLKRPVTKICLLPITE